MNIFYEEVLVSADPDRGVEFNSLLMILAHYKVINDNKSLRLEEFLRRRARLQRVEEAVRRNVVVGFFDTLYWARRFRKAVEARKSSRITMVPQLGVPEIYIQDDGEDSDNNTGLRTPSTPTTPIDRHTSGWTTGSETGTPLFNTFAANNPLASRPGPGDRSNSNQTSPSASPTRPRVGSHASPSDSRDIPEDWHFAEALIDRSRSPSPSPRHLDPDATPLDAYGGSGLGVGSRNRSQTLSASFGPEQSRSRAGTLSVAGSTPVGSTAGGGGNSTRSRAGSSVNNNTQDVLLDVLDTSAWGESIRRSFTTRASTSMRSSVGGGAVGSESVPPPIPGVRIVRTSSSSSLQEVEEYERGRRGHGRGHDT
jgi:hypothetical protein